MLRELLRLGSPASLLGLAVLPDPQALRSLGPADAAPPLLGERGALPLRQRMAILRELVAPRGSDVLRRHLALGGAVSQCPLVTSNAVRLLIDGPATHQAMFAAIDAARDHINLETYLIEDDEVGHRLAEMLIDKQARGVQVNLIYDSVGSFRTSRRFFQRLREAGIRVCEFNPVNPWRAKRWRPNHRDHRKILVVDGAIAFTGGLNISSVYSSGSAGNRAGRPDLKSGWRDTHLEIEGPAVAQFQKLFLETWKRQSGDDLPPGNYFPRLACCGDKLLRVIPSSPDGKLSTMYLALLSAIRHARNSIYLSMAYFAPDPHIVAALKDAARRGVAVKLILPGFSDSLTVLHAGRSHYADLMSAGVLIFERRDAMLHAKTAVIDGVWSTVGSTNMDWRSFLHNDEVNAIVLGREFGAQMEHVFEEDLRGSTPIDPETWAERPLRFKASEFAARMLEYWI